MGKWLKNNDIKNNIIIATKLGALPKDNKNTGFSNMQGLSRNVILENVKRSLYNDFEIF
ncbi:MAG: hypothetical protein E7214_04435 [Clostridium sp.]|nr:hypothetical protein [Clostridium sp.]